MIVPATWLAPESKPLLIRAVLGGRSVAASLAPDGTLTVSIAGVGKPFRAHVATARQAAQALIRALRGVNATVAPPGGPSLVAPGGPVIPTTVPGLPTGATVSLPVGYEYRTNDRVRPAMHGFASPDEPTVSLVLGLDPGRPLTPDVAPVSAQWLVKESLLGKTLSVRGSAMGGLSVRYAKPEPSARFVRVPVVATREETPRAAVVAIFTALTYRPAS